MDSESVVEDDSDLLTYGAGMSPSFMPKLPAEGGTMTTPSPLPVG